MTENVLFKVEEPLWQVVRPVTVDPPYNKTWKKGLEVYGARKDCEAYIKIEESGYLHPSFRLEPYREADWNDTENCEITARDFQSLKAEEQVEYLKLPYDKRALVRRYSGR